MKRLVLDVETTISNKGNPFDETNRLCYVGLLTEATSVLHAIEYSSEPYGSNLLSIQSSINDCELLIGFNIKFDLHWIRRYGITFSTKRIWDCQLVHFILSGQTASYPSLNGVAAHYGLGTKLDVVSTEYWKNGIDTPNVPKDTLEEYLQGDLDLTYQVYLKQLEEVQASSPQLQRLISLHNQDLLVLEEMEYNGLIFDEARSTELAQDLTEQIKRLDVLLLDYHQTDDFNSNSTEHLSALLYGGTINLKRREVIGVFKTGTRAGEPKERWIDYPVTFPKLINPLRGSELAKEGFYSTDEATLKSLKGSKNAKELVELLLRRATLEKRLSTYYEGLVKLRKEMKWSEGKLHGQLNQCVARTGRLSSSRPNLQNFDGEIKELFRSRYVS
jgi:DNA polymerase I-like protein with 3'-5' exonuclease and polymerase domains